MLFCNGFVLQIPASAAFARNMLTNMRAHIALLNTLAYAIYIGLIKPIMAITTNDSPKKIVCLTIII